MFFCLFEGEGGKGSRKKFNGSVLRRGGGSAAIKKKITFWGNFLFVEKIPTAIKLDGTLPLRKELILRLP